MATPEQREAIIELYSAYFNRAADAGGANFWANSFDIIVTQTPVGVDAGQYALAQIAASISNSAEYQALYPPTLSTEEFLTEIYKNLLNREPDAEGLAFWVDSVNQGAVTTENAILSIIAGAKANDTPQGLIDAALLENKTLISKYVVETLESNDVDLAKFAFQDITEDAASVDAIKANLDLVAEGPQSETDAVTGDVTTTTYTFVTDSESGVITITQTVKVEDSEGNLISTEITETDPATGNETVTATDAATGDSTITISDSEGNLLSTTTIEPGDVVYTSTDSVTGEVTVTTRTSTGTFISQEVTTNVETALASTYDSVAIVTVIDTATNISAADLATLLANGVDAVEVADPTNEDATVTIAQAAIIAASGLSATYSITDIAANIVAGDALNGATDIILTDTATVAQATILVNATNSGETSFSLEDEAAAIVAAGDLLNSATDIIVTDAVDLAGAAIIEAATNNGSNTYAIDDTATLISESTNEVLDLATAVTVNTAAAIAEAANIVGFNQTIAYDIEDIGANIVAGDALNGATDITVTDSVTVEQAGIIEAATTGVKTYAIDDSAANVAASSDAVLDLATAVTVNTAATVAEAGTLLGFAQTISFDISDSAANLAASTTEIVGAAGSVTVDDSATLADLDAIAALATGDVIPTDIADAADVLAADITWIKLATGTVTVEGAAALAELDAIQAQIGLGAATLATGDITDTLANLTADTSGWVAAAAAGTAITVEDVATLAELDAVAALGEGTVVATSITGTVADLTADTNGWVAGASAGATIIVEDVATLAQLDAIAALGAGTVVATAITGTVADLTADTNGWVAGASVDATITVEDAAALTDLDDIAALGAGTVVATNIADIVADLTADTNGWVAGASVDATVAVTDVATLAELNTIDALGDGSVVPSDITDSAGLLAADTTWIQLATGNVTTNTAASLANLEAIQTQADLGTATVVTVDITDNAANLAADTTWVEGASGTVTANTAATVAQATNLDAFTKAVVFAVSDSFTNVFNSNNAALDEATSVTANGTAGDDVVDFSALSVNLTILAGAGNDAVTVGTGGSSVTGGAGADATIGNAGTVETYIYSNGDTSVAGVDTAANAAAAASLTDTITAFIDAEDLLDLTALTAVTNASAVNDQSGAAIAHVATNDGDILVTQATTAADAIVWVNTGGGATTGFADFEEAIYIVGGAANTWDAADFIFPV